MHNDKCTRLIDTLGQGTLLLWCVISMGDELLKSIFGSNG